MSQWPMIMGKRNQEAMSQMNAWINGELVQMVLSVKKNKQDLEKRNSTYSHTHALDAKN